MMPAEVNAAGQALGWRVDGWTAPPFPPREPMAGRTCRLEPLDVAAHAAHLHEANRRDATGGNWTYLPYGPFETLAAYVTWAAGVAAAADPQFHTVIDLATGTPVGVASYLRIDPGAGSIEVGHIHYSPLLQRTVAATEAMYLMMKRAFELGYRRYEWKCNALNAPSRAAAMRLGFSYEGLFRQARVDKGRNRDTAWYAMIDKEWPALDAAFRRWLDPSNFDERGRQRVALSALTAPILVSRG
ncbi:MAG TPA: GNAT family protein [Vicinamibacterales bacterium]|jgi:RimJ/RimL family protein N-acetyltransferase|nr:GNAT family protein [Vicinamibacterales bacterium]